jgi:hypothetical protein
MAIKFSAFQSHRNRSNIFHTPGRVAVRLDSLAAQAVQHTQVQVGNWLVAEAIRITK